MDESWNRYLRLGIVHFMAFPAVMGGEGPYAETIREIARDPFFTAIEVGLGARRGRARRRGRRAPGESPRGRVRRAVRAARDEVQPERARRADASEGR